MSRPKTQPKQPPRRRRFRITPNLLRHIVAWPAALLAVAAIASGLLIENNVQWRLQLLLGLWLLSLPPRALMASRDKLVSRGMGRLVLVMILGFCGVGLQLTRMQIIEADELQARAASILNPTPVPTPTPQPIFDQPVVAEAGEDEPMISVVRPAERTGLGVERTFPVEVVYGPRGVIYDRFGGVLATNQNGRRIYTNPEIGHIIGFDSAVYGKTNVEAAFDQYLSGDQSIRPADMLLARTFDGATVTTNPADVYLTLDSGLQQIAQNALGARPGAVVVLDPQSGAVLAMATYPRFDPNLFTLPDPATQADVESVEAIWQQYANRTDGPLLNRATQGRYPPGSVFKTLTAAAAIDSQVMPFPESAVTCPNRLFTENNAPPVRNAVEGLAGQTGNPSNLRLVYAWSCNTAFAQIGLLLGPELYIEYARRFGLGFADEAGLTPDLQDIAADKGTLANEAAFLQRPAALADTAFGQGQILITPLDMAQMVATIANDGGLMRPYLVQEVRSGDQVLYQAQPTVLRQVMSPQAAATMRAVMKSSVDIGYAAPANIAGVNVGGKTGTAELPSGQPHSWFVAIAPVENPRYAIAVVVERGGEGSQTALPVARQVLQAALR